MGPLWAMLGMMGLTMISVSECTSIQMITPAFTAVLATIFFGEKYDIMLFLNPLNAEEINVATPIKLVLYRSAGEN